MEGTIMENNGAPSAKVDEKNAEGKAVAAHSKDQEPDFKLVDTLHSAATSGDITKLQDHGGDLDQILTPLGNTILHIYIISRPVSKTADQPNKCEKKSEKEIQQTQQEAEFIKRVLEKCPNLLLKANEKGETLLHFAARYGHDHLVKELIKECEELCCKDPEKYAEAKKMMLKKTNEAKDTALHEAVRYNHIDVVDRLIKADSELAYEANSSGETPLYLAAERGNSDVVKKFSQSAADRGPMGRTALHAAVIRRDKDMTKDLLEKKEYLSREKDELGRFALHYAACLGYDEIVEELVDKYRSAAYQVDNDGKTALHLAASNGKAKAVKKLIEMCPNCCELVDNRGRNALHLALTSADEPTIEIFLKDAALGNLINQKDKEGNTPLLQLANFGSDIGIFIDHDRVDKLVFNKENKSAADIILDKDLNDQNMFLRRLSMIKEMRYRRIVVPKPEVREGIKVNRPCTISTGKVIETKEGGSEGIKKTKKEGNEDMMKQKGDGVNEDTKRKSDDGTEEIIKGAEETQLVAATLIATVTFAAGFTLPGGYIGEDNRNEGTALLTKSAAFQAFVIFDTLAFVLSCASVVIHLTMRLQKDKTQLLKQFIWALALTFDALLAMVLAFVTGIYAILYPNKSLALTVCIIGCLFGALSSPQYLHMGMFILNLKDLSSLKKKKKARSVRFYLD